MFLWWRLLRGFAVSYRLPGTSRLQGPLQKFNDTSDGINKSRSGKKMEIGPSMEQLSKGRLGIIRWAIGRSMPLLSQGRLLDS